MSTGKHSAQTPSEGLHVLQNWEKTASERAAMTGLVAADVGKVLKETDTLNFYILTDHSPITWAEITPGSVSETITTLTESPTNVFTYTSEDSTVTEIDISNFETTTELNTRDTNNRDRANHTGTQTSSTISDFDAEVSNNSDVSANTAKVTNATHTGEVTGSGALTVDPTAISNKTSVTAAATDEILIGDASDSGNLKKVTAQSIADLGGGGGGGVGTYLDRATPTINTTFATNTTNDFTTEADAVSVDVTFTPAHTAKYLITLSFTWSLDSGTFDFDGELQIDSSTVRKIKQEPQDGGGTEGDSGTDQRHLGYLEWIHDATASTSFNVKFLHACLGSDGVEATVKDSILRIERYI